MSGESVEDRAIKKSAANEPEYEPRPKADRLTSGPLYDAVRSLVDKKVDPSWIHCKVMDYPSFDPAFQWYRINYYYQHDTDPTTTLDSFVVTVDDVRKVYQDVDTVS